MLLGRLVVFTLTSSVSYVGMLLIMFSLFRINYRWYIPHMVFVCVSLSYISFTTRLSSLAVYSPFVQMGFLIILLWLLFRFHPFHAVIMGVMGMVGFGVVDLSVGYIFVLFGYRVAQLSVQMHVMGIIAGLLGIGVAAFISRQNWGFSFVREDERVKVNFQEKNIVLMMTVCGLSVIALLICYYFVDTLSSPASLLATVIVQFLGASLLIYLSGKRERQQYEQKRGRMWMGE